MVCEEQAIKALILAGVAEKDPERGYRLLWDKLEARKAVERNARRHHCSLPEYRKKTIQIYLEMKRYLK